MLVDDCSSRFDRDRELVALLLVVDVVDEVLVDGFGAFPLWRNEVFRFLPVSLAMLVLIL